MQINTIQPFSYQGLAPRNTQQSTGQTNSLNPTFNQLPLPQFSPSYNVPAPIATIPATINTNPQTTHNTKLPLVLSCVGALAGVVNVAFNIAKLIEW